MKTYPSWRPTESVTPPQYLRLIHSPLALLTIIGVAAYISFANYLLFHTAVESFTIFVSLSIAVIVLNTYHLVQNSYFTFLGTSFAFTAIFDFFHTISYNGMGVFLETSANMPTQMWIIARFIECISMLAASIFVHRRVSPIWLLTIYTTTSALFLTSVLYWRNFPECWNEYSGLTSFKIAAEYIIIVVILAAVVLLMRHKEFFHPRVYSYMFIAYLTTMGTEIAFTLYQHVYGLENMLGHLLKLLAYFFLYRAIIETSLNEPYNTLFYQLQQANGQLSQANEELEAQTEELADLNGKLLKEIGERQRAEAVIKEAYTELQLIFNTAAEGLWVIDRNYRFVRINNTMLKQLGLSEKEVIGKQCYDVIQGPFCGTDLCPFRQLAQGSGLYERDVDLVSRDGQIHSYIVSAQPIQYRKGEIAMIVASFKNITERRKNEKGLKRDYELAETIQRSSLPPDIETEYFSLQTFYQPCHHISGDSYDYIWDHEKKRLFGFIIDVMGHGLHTAMQTAALKVIFRQAANQDISLKHKMAWINRMSNPCFFEDSFAAAVCFEYDAKTSTLRYAAAGINFFLAVINGNAHIVKTPGLMLGIAGDIEFDEYELALDPGDSVIFMSDGLWDNWSLKDKEGIHSFDDALVSLKDLIGRKLADDATALCLNVKGGRIQ